jgi:hypothetical protein
MDANDWAVYQVKRGNSGRTSCFDDNPREYCCLDESIDSFGDCDHFSTPSGPSKREADQLAKSNEYFYKQYLKAWDMATNNGWKLNKMSS